MPQVTKNLRDGIMRIKDTAGPYELELALESGNLTWDEPSCGAVINVLDRGDLSHMRQGDEAPVTGSFSLKFVEFVHQDTSTEATLYEAINNLGSIGSLWSSTNTDGGDVYTLTMEFEIASPTSGERNELLTFTKCTFTPRFTEGDETNEIAYDFQAFITKPSIAKTGSTIA